MHPQHIGDKKFRPSAKPLRSSASCHPRKQPELAKPGNFPDVVNKTLALLSAGSPSGTSSREPSEALPAVWGFAGLLLTPRSVILSALCWAKRPEDGEARGTGSKAGPVGSCGASMARYKHTRSRFLLAQSCDRKPGPAAAGDDNHHL